MPAESIPIHEQRAPGILEDLGKLTGVLGLLAAYSFFSGYELLSSYFREFGIPLWLLDLPAYTYPLHSRTPIILFVGTLLIALLVSFIILRVPMVRTAKTQLKPLKLPSRNIQFGLWISVAVVAICFLLTGLTSYEFGISRAQEDVASNSATVTLAFKTSSPDAPRDERLLEANKAGRLRMLTQTKDLVIIYEHDSKKTISTYVVARSELSSVRSSDIQ